MPATQRVTKTGRKVKGTGESATSVLVYTDNIDLYNGEVQCTFSAISEAGAPYAKVVIRAIDDNAIDQENRPLTVGQNVAVANLSRKMELGEWLIDNQFWTDEE